MKTVSLLIVMASALLFYDASARIKNGYVIHEKLSDSLQTLSGMLEGDRTRSTSERKMLKAKMRVIINYLACYQATEILLQQFAMISPDIYREIDSIRDARGRRVDVYVRFIQRDQATVMAAGLTRMSHLAGDTDLCLSEYGPHTVSIKIWTINEALNALSHEFGHVSFQVPNFARYTSYYRAQYRGPDTMSDCIGHAASDVSGQQAISFERRFKHATIDYRLQMPDYRYAETPVAMVQHMRKRIYMNLRFN